MNLLTLFRLCVVLVTASHVLADPNHRGSHFGNGAGNGNGATNGNGQNTTTSAVAATTTSIGNSANSSAAASSVDTAAAAASTTAASDASAGNTSGNSALELNPNNVQTASDSTGGAVAEAGQSDSITDPANFINFCTGQTLTNGTQITSGSCNGVVMGEIPSKNNMISSIIVNPAPGDVIPANQNFSISVQVQNLVAGTFTNPNTAYYSAPQQLSGGNIIGHTHVTVQTLGNSLTPNTPPDPTTFMFFKGINDAGNGNGLLSALVGGGLPAGNYRVCTMTAASNHQPVLMPVAQRGAQDDCTKFTVTDTSGSTNTATNGGNQNGQQTTEQTATTSGGVAYGGRRIRRYERRYAY